MVISPALNLIVLRCADLAVTRRFYEAIGMTFVEEQHGAGAAHLSSTLGPLVIELYPASAKNPPDRTGLGFVLADVAVATPALLSAGGLLRQQPASNSAVFTDPDGRRVEFRDAT